MMSRLETVLQMLWERSRFTSYFYQSVQFRAEISIPTLALYVAGRRVSLLFNPEFIHAINPEELIGLLVHEMMHIVLHHDHRSLPHQDPVLRNLAQDMVVNSYLIDHRETFFSRTHQGTRDYPGLSLPAGLPKIPDRFLQESGTEKKEDVTWEDLYHWLADKDNATMEDPSDQTDLADYRWKPFSLSGSDPDGVMETGREGLSVHGRDLKNLPTGMHLFRNSDDQTAVEALQNRVISYSGQDENCRDERFFQYISSMIQKIQPFRKPFSLKSLKAFVESASMSAEWNYSTSRFDRRYFASGLYTPGRAYRKKKIVTVAVDVSGSMVMHPETLEAAFGVVEKLLDQYKVFLLCIDETVFVPFKHNNILQKSGSSELSYQYQKGDWRYIQTGNSGTTFFAPLFDRFMQGHHEPLVVITDGDIYDLDRLKRYPQTLWVIARQSEKTFQPPFGKVVTM